MPWIPTMPAVRLQCKHIPAAAPKSEALHVQDRRGRVWGGGIFNPWWIGSYKMKKVDIIPDGYKMMKIRTRPVDWEKLEVQTCAF